MYFEWQKRSFEMTAVFGMALVIIVSVIVAVVVEPVRIALKVMP